MDSLLLWLSTSAAFATVGTAVVMVVRWAVHRSNEVAVRAFRFEQLVRSMNALPCSDHAKRIAQLEASSNASKQKHK